MSVAYPIVRELEEADSRWLADGRRMADTLLRRYVVAVGDTRMPEGLDSVYMAWCADTREDLPSLQFLYQGLGILLGDLFRERFNYDWKCVTDEFGTEISLVMAAPNDTLVVAVLSPLSMVGKRLRLGQRFFADVFHAIAARDERDGFAKRAEAAPTGRK